MEERGEQSTRDAGVEWGEVLVQLHPGAGCPHPLGQEGRRAGGQEG